MSSPSASPTTGAAILLSGDGRGWDPPALLLPSPLVLLRFRAGIVRLLLPGAREPFLTREGDPLPLLDDLLDALRQHIPKAGPKAPKPSFPLAVIAAGYEFGARFDPHRDCFPHAGALEDDEFFAAIHLDAYRPDSRGGSERMGYAGRIPADWYPGAPALETPPYGHEPPPVIPFPAGQGAARQPLTPLWDAAAHRARIARLKEYLAAGDIYQANLTVPFSGTTAARPEDLFDIALQRGGASYAMTFLTPAGTILSFSPELFLRRRGADVETRPIKGTRTIASHAGGVHEAREALLSSGKDRAEHVMIVDLERNDLGRLCLNNSVNVSPLAEPVEHPTVLHLESRVRGKLPPGVTVHDLFAATFPGGSVTGAPKRRALEIIGELEESPRGIYCGALGWIDCDGDCDLNLPIRTALIRPDGRLTAHFGGGIVADSDPDGEWAEIEHKLAFLKKVLEEAEG